LDLRQCVRYMMAFGPYLQRAMQYWHQELNRRSTIHSHLLVHVWTVLWRCRIGLYGEWSDGDFWNQMLWKKE